MYSFYSLSILSSQYTNYMYLDTKTLSYMPQIISTRMSSIPPVSNNQLPCCNTFFVHRFPSYMNLSSAHHEPYAHVENNTALCKVWRLQVFLNFFLPSSIVGVMDASRLLCLVGVNWGLGVGVVVVVVSVPFTAVRPERRARLLGVVISGVVLGLGVWDLVDVIPDAEKDNDSIYMAYVLKRFPGNRNLLHDCVEKKGECKALHGGWTCKYILRQII